MSYLKTSAQKVGSTPHLWFSRSPWWPALLLRTHIHRSPGAVSVAGVGGGGGRGADVTAVQADIHHGYGNSGCRDRAAAPFWGKVLLRGIRDLATVQLQLLLSRDGVVVMVVVDYFCIHPMEYASSIQEYGSIVWSGFTKTHFFNNWEECNASF